MSGNVNADSTARWREVFAQFERLIELPLNERQKAMGELEVNSPELYPRVLTLLAADGAAESENFMGRAPIDRLPDADCAAMGDVVDLSGQTVGAYRFLRPIGSGGMGQVWLAERADGRFDGQVAIKLLRSFGDLATAQRFEREGHLLGRLQHPNIARLLDAGAMSNGQLYLVLEYVDGERIDRAFDQRRLPLGARVEAFLRVCDAISHAHANLIVHRDLKPSNILVASDGAIKVLDFGIAKMLEQRFAYGDDAQSELTELAGRAFTPEFAAPEQIRGEAVSTQTDVYSLGALLFRLLAGIAPHAGVAVNTSSIQKRAFDAQSPRMSEAVVAAARTQGAPLADCGKLAAARATLSDRLPQLLRGDLDTIVAKAIKISPAERYRTVAELHDDLVRYLRHEPIAARTDGVSYRIGKFVRRHRIGVAASVALAMAVIAGVSSTLWQASLVRERSALAQANALQALSNAREAHASALRAKVFEADARNEAARALRGEADAKAHAARAQGLAHTALAAQIAADRNAADAREKTAAAERYRARAETETASAARELVRAERVSSFLATAFREQDPLSRAGSNARSSAALLVDAVRDVERELADDPVSQARLFRVLGEAQLNVSDNAAAKRSLQLALDRLNQQQGNESYRLRAEVESLRGALALRELRRDDADRHFDAATAHAIHADGAQGLEVARVDVRRVKALLELTRFREAKASIERAYRILSEKLGRAHPESVAALASLSVVQLQLREDAAAAKTLNEVIELTAKHYGPDDARLIDPLVSMGELQRRQRTHDAARKNLARAIEIAEKRIGEKNGSLASAFSTLAAVERDIGRAQPAIDALERAERSLPDGDFRQRAEILARRGSIHSEMEQLAPAERDLREALKMRKASEGAQSSGLTWYTQAQLAEVIAGQKKPGALPEAEALYDEATIHLRRLVGVDGYQNALIASLRTRTYELYGDWPAAIREIREAIRLNEKAYGVAGHFGHLTWGFTLAKLWLNVDGGVAEAQRLADRLIEQWANNPKGVEEYVAVVLFRCDLYLRSSDTAKARELAQRMLAMSAPTPNAAQRERLEKLSQTAKP